MDNQRQVLVTDPHTIVEYQDGATFIARKVEGSPVVTIAAFITAGSYHDKIPGTGHFYEHLPFFLSANFKDSSVFNYMGSRKGEISAYTAFDHTAFYGHVAKEYANDAIFAVADISCRSMIEDSRFYEEKTTIIDETAFQIMEYDCDISRHAALAAYGSRLPLPVIGRVETIEQIKPDDVRAFFDNHYIANNLIVAIEGDFDQHQVLDEAKKQFRLPRGLNAATVAPLPFSPHVEIYPTTQGATRALVIFPSWLESPSTTTKEKMASFLLGDVLFDFTGPVLQEMRLKKRLVYAVNPVSSFSDNSITMGHAAVRFDAYPHKIPAAVESLADIVRRFAENPDRDLLEVARAKKIHGHQDQIRRQAEKGAWGLANVARTCAKIEPRDNFLTAAQETTLDDVAAAARRYLTSGDVSLLYIGQTRDNFPDHLRFGSLSKLSL